MINTFHDLLQAFKDKGVSEIEPYLNIGHNPIIGDMYEGLTKNIMERSIFKGLDLHVVSGKITNDLGNLSKQIDCMIVKGKGKKLPFSDNFIYNIKDVIAIIEVKKKLFSKELSDAYDNLYSVVNIETFEKELNFKIFRDAFESMSKIKLPKRDDLETLSENSKMLYHNLLAECILPIRVAFGYDGYNSEYSLRKNFVEYIEKQCKSNAVNNKMNPLNLPNLVIVKENSLVKTNGMPFVGSTDEDSFCWIASYRKNPLLIFLELLWTRLTYYFDIPSDIFGEDLILQSLAPLLLVKWTKERVIYDVIQYSDSTLASLGDDIEWEPIKLSNSEYRLLDLLSQREELYINQELEKILKLDNENLEEIIKKLNINRLVCCEDDTIKFLTKECKVVIFPDGNCYAADDFDGRFTKWINKKLKNDK